MNKKRILAVLSAIGIVTSLTGCGSLGVGEEEFACTGMPGSVYCHSARDVYEKTNDGVVPSPVGRAEGAYNEDCDDCVRAEDINPSLRVEEDENSRYAVGAEGSGEEKFIEVIDQKTGDHRIVKKKSLHVTNDEVINNYVAPRLPYEPVPIRTPSQVMRIWIAPFVDTNGDLIAPGFVYTEIEPRRWIYPDEQGANAMNSKRFEPLQNAKKYPAYGRKTPSEANNSLQDMQKSYQKKKRSDEL